MFRYCAAWLLTEGAAIWTGIAYNGKNALGEDRWDGVRDLHIVKFELGGDFQSVIESFNCGTNTFAKKYVNCSEQICFTALHSLLFSATFSND